MFELPTIADIIKILLVTGLAYYVYNLSQEQEKESKKREQEQKELIDSTTNPILTQAVFKCHMQTCLTKLSLNTLEKVTITDEKDLQKWVVLTYEEYERLCDREKSGD